MQIIIFLLEVILVFFLYEMEKSPSMTTIKKEDVYSSYSSLNIIGENALLLQDIPKADRIKAWRSSPLKEEILSELPNIDVVLYLVNERMEGDESFKKKFMEYIEHIHGKYLAQQIDYDGLKEAIANPNPALPSF